MKKKMVIGIIVAVVLCGGYFIGSGFLRNGSVYMDGYSVSGDGREITLDIGVAASRGYIRKMEISQQMGGKLYIDCYAAFGGHQWQDWRKEQLYAAAGRGYDNDWDLSK